MITFSKLGQTGRLGNQMFQMAATIGIARANNLLYGFPKWDYSHYFNSNITASHMHPKAFFKEIRLDYAPVRVSEYTDLDGYFMTEKYFKHCEEEVRAFFEWNPKTILKILGKITHDAHSFNNDLEGKTCSIHVRRGDFLTLPGYFPVLDADYYHRAIARMRLLVKKPLVFMVFSDDIAWCKQQFKGHMFHFSEGMSDIEDLCLMSHCSHHIIANSSFSWWGAWLGQYSQKQVIAPNIWFGPENGWYDQQQDIIPENWIRI